MKKTTIVIALILNIASLLAAQNPVLHYNIDVTQNTDTFSVELSLEGKINKTARIFQFAATAPGTYQTMNIGRYVRHFQVYDRKGKPVHFEKISENQFRVSSPQKVQKITYKVAETWDTSVDLFPIYPMAGTSIEKDHALINPHAIIGFFAEYQHLPYHVSITSPSDWQAGTPLLKKGNLYMADNYDHLVDSPILLGNLSYASTKIEETIVEIYTYSENGIVNSQALLDDMSTMLKATHKYLGKLPVDRYTFLYHFEKNTPQPNGAWEHSYSSEYTLLEPESISEAFMSSVTNIASHEFFHIVTPLNIHSELVETFNFAKPNPSKHLWLYEGVTEWASHILLLKDGVVTLEDYINNSLKQKILIDKFYFDKSYSLGKLAKESYTEEGAKQYGNIYYKGSMAATLLDIRLLDLSNGKYGLKELILELVHRYGKGKPVPEDTFIDIIVDMTFPEIKSFFEDFIFDKKPFPYKEYFSKIGLIYEEKPKGEGYLSIYPAETMTDRQQMLFEAWSK